MSTIVCLFVGQLVLLVGEILLVIILHKHQKRLDVTERGFIKYLDIISKKLDLKD